MKVQLIRPPLDDWYQDSTPGQLDKYISPPIGLALIAKALIKHDVDVEIIDGMSKDLDYLLEKIDADVVGVTDVYSFHLNALSVAKKAKQKGAITLVGGANVTHIAPRILANHPYVDYAVVGDGETQGRRSPGAHRVGQELLGERWGETDRKLVGRGIADDACSVDRGGDGSRGVGVGVGVGVEVDVGVEVGV